MVLYGPPGIGKETIARYLAEHSGYKFFPQRLTHDLASLIFGDTPAASSDYERQLCLHALNEFLTQQVGGVVFTHRYAHPEGAYFARALVRFVKRNAISAVFVRISCNLEEHFLRASNDARRKTAKVDTIGKLDKWLAKQDFFTDIPGVKTRTVDTTNLSAEESASLIKRWL